MDVYFEAQRGFGFELHIRPFYRASVASGLLAEHYRFFQGLVLITKGDPVFAVEAIEALEVYITEASQISSIF